MKFLGTQDYGNGEAGRRESAERRRFAICSQCCLHLYTRYLRLTGAILPSRSREEKLHVCIAGALWR